MVAVKTQTVKKEFAGICERVFGGEAIIISRPHDENIVMISEKEYAKLEKARRNMEYLAKIDRGIAQKLNGTMQEHELIED